MSIIPKYYLVHQTPQGKRYAYPRSLVESVTQKSMSFSYEATVSVVQPAGAQFALTKDWLVADAVLETLTKSKPGALRSAGWVKRDSLDEDGLVSPDLQRTFEKAAPTPEEGEIEHWMEHDAAHACWRCLVFVSTYREQWVDGEPVITTERFDDWAPLPGEPDANSDLNWTVDDPSLLAIYGAHTAHLWPGKLAGLREEVGQRLQKHPLSDNFYDWHDSRSTDRNYFGFSVRFHVPWETPQTTTRMVKPYGKRRAQPQIEQVWAMRPEVQLFVPLGVSGATKAEAVAGFEAAVQEQMARFLPFGDNPRACDHCHGTGRVNGDVH